MQRRGSFAPETEADARERYEALGRTAQVLVKEVAKAMSFDREEYDRRVTPAVIETARETLFAQELEVLVDDRAGYEDWLKSRQYEAFEAGSDEVDNVAWHPAPFAGQVVAATFQDEADAAVETVRRQAVGRIYRDRVGE